MQQYETAGNAELSNSGRSASLMPRFLLCGAVLISAMGSAHAQTPVAHPLQGLILVLSEPGAQQDTAALVPRQLCPQAAGDPANANLAGTPAPQAQQSRDQLAQTLAQSRVQQSSAILNLLPASVLNRTQAQAALSPFIGQDITGDLTKAIVAAVVQSVSQSSRYLSDVYFPVSANTQIKDGILTLVVRPARLGQVIAQGQQHYKAEDLECRIHLQSGQAIDLQQIASDIQVLNTNSSWRQTNPVPEFRPGTVPGTTDIVLNTTDSKPQRVFMGADNTGTRATGVNRYRAGFSVGNFLNHFDHQIDYSYTTASSPERFSNHSLGYSMPLDGPDRIALRIDYSKTHVWLQGDTFESKGSNLIGSLEWTRALSAIPSSPPTTHPDGTVSNPIKLQGEAFAGLEIKHIGSALAFGQTQVSDSAPRVGQTYAGWRNGWRDNLGANQLNLRMTYSPGKTIGHNTNDDFAATRADAKSTYWRFNTNYDRSFYLPGEALRGWQINARASAQYANAALLSSERFGLSGVGGVRGYYQDTLFADAGITGNLELQTPTKQWGEWRNQPLQANALIFADAARSKNYSDEHNADLNATGRNFSLASRGIGLRVSAGPLLNLRLDVAKRTSGLTDQRGWMWHGYAQIGF